MVSNNGIDELNVVIIISEKILFGIEISVFIKWEIILFVWGLLMVENSVIKVLVE